MDNITWDVAVLKYEITELKTTMYVVEFQLA